jgi:hypothetical protein
MGGEGGEKGGEVGKGRRGEGKLASNLSMYKAWRVNKRYYYLSERERKRCRTCDGGDPVRLDHLGLEVHAP